MNSNKETHTTDSRYKVPNLERALVIMEHLTKHPEGLGLSELTNLLGFSKNSVFRITMTLQSKGYLLRDEKTKRFTLSRKLLAMGHTALCDKPIIPNALDIMADCRNIIKETILIGTIIDTECVVMEQVLGSHPFKFSVDLGTRLQLHVSAPGKVLMAYMPEKQCKALVDRLKLVKYNEKTITTKSALMDELKQVKECGFALDRGEELHGIACVAAPVFNQHGLPVAAIWTTGPADRIPEESYSQIGSIIREHAGRISERLGYQKD